MNTKMSKKKKIFLAVDLIMIILLVALDQFTKYLACEYLQDKPAIPIIKGVLELNFLKNSGAAFGMLQNQKFFILFPEELSGMQLRPSRTEQDHRVLGKVAKTDLWNSIC